MQHLAVGFKIATMPLTKDADMCRFFLRQFQTGQIVVSLQIIPKPVLLVVDVPLHFVALQYDCFFTYNPIIPADYKSRRRPLPYEVPPPAP